MSQLVRAIVKIEGMPYQYAQLTIQQRIDWHHSFEIKMALSTAGSSLQEQAEELIGKSVRIEWQYTAEANFRQQMISDGNSLDGVVRDVSLIRSRQSGPVLRIKGQSISCLMDDGPHTRSFSEKSLQQIADSILEEYGSIFPEADNQPVVDFRHSKSIPYLVQYKESNYRFLARVAAEYNEWFYFDGNKLVMGHPEETDAIPLIYGEEDFDSFELSLRTLPVATKFKGYDFIKHEFPEVESALDQELSTYGALVHDKSKDDLFGKSKEHLTPVIRQMDKDQLQMLANRFHNMKAQSMIRLNGASRNPNLRIGGRIEISDDTSEEFGVYIVTSLQHSIDTKSRYYNVFEAVPEKIQAPPVNAHIEPPFCETQVAEVTETNDPEKLGRVRVRFIWQQGTEETSPWIRVATPSTGSDKGFFLVPEIGDYVLMDFEHHDPDNPYVLSGFFHGKAKPSWQDDENNVKAWVTRSGHQILLNDKSGEESVLISNPEGKNTITLSLGDQPSISIQSEGSISISAKESISMSAKNINISASEDMSVSGKMTGIQGSDECNVSGAKALNLSSDTEANLGAAKVKVTGQAETSVSGAIIKLNS